MELSDLLFLVLLVAFSLIPKKRNTDETEGKAWAPEEDGNPEQTWGEEDFESTEKIRKRIEQLRQARQKKVSEAPNADSTACARKEGKRRIHTPSETVKPSTAPCKKHPVEAAPAQPINTSFFSPEKKCTPVAFPTLTLKNETAPFPSSAAMESHANRSQNIPHHKSRLRTWIEGQIVLDQPRFKKEFHGGILDR